MTWKDELIKILKNTSHLKISLLNFDDPGGDGGIEKGHSFSQPSACTPAYVTSVTSSVM